MNVLQEMISETILIAHEFDGCQNGTNKNFVVQVVSTRAIAEAV